MPDLKALFAQRAELDKQIEKAQKEQKAGAIAQVKNLIAEYVLSAADCGFGVSSAGKVKKPVVAKYRSPKGETWSGRGKPPRWIVGYEQSGKNRSDLLI